MLYQAELHSDISVIAYNAKFDILQEGFVIFLFFLGITVKKSIIIAVLLLCIVAALCFIFYPKSKEKEEIALSNETFVSNQDLAVLPTKASEKQQEMNSSRLKVNFDIVRVEEDGSMIAAGKGEKGAAFSLMDGESVLAEISVNEDGEWVYIPSKPLVVGAHEIWLRDSSQNVREESEVVVVNVPEPKNTEEVLTVMMSSDAEDINVLQAPAPQIQIDLDIRSVNYVNNAFIVQGTAHEAGDINVYVDNLFLGKVRSDGSEWSLRVARKLEAGKKYLIRADKVDSRGKVTARVEVPFEMEKGLEKDKSRRIRIVKGDCLWSIAKQLYGTGFAYVTIYQANKNQIKDPNLIYPNQVFVLPMKSEK